MFNEIDNFQCEEQKNQIFEKFINNSKDELNLISVDYLDINQCIEEKSIDDMSIYSIYGTYNPPFEKEAIKIEREFSLEAYLYRIIKKMKVMQIKKVT